MATKRTYTGVVKLKNGLWQASWTVNGRLIRRRFPTKVLAQAARDKARTAILEGCYLDKRKIVKTPFEEAVKQFLKWGETNLVEATPINDRHISKTWLESRFFAGKTLDQITTADVERFKQDRAQNGVCRNTSRNNGLPLSRRAVDIELVRLKRMFSVAIEQGLTDKNPAAKVKLIRKDKKHEDWLKAEEENRLIAVASPRMRRLILFAIYTGMRKGEILNMIWSDVDLTNRTIIIPGERAKSREDRNIFLNETALAVLNELPRPLDQSTLVFGNKKGKVDSNLGREWRSVLLQSGIPHYRFHDLRHTFGSRLGSAGESELVIGKLMGHSSGVMTRRYVHLASSKLHESVRILDSDRQKSDNKNENDGVA